jgi:hypothetical protein
MGSTWISETFPHFEEALRELVQQHRQLEGEPLHLAMTFAPERDPRDIFLLEVLSGILSGTMNEDRELFEVSFLSSSGFPLEPKQELHLILTNRTEFKAALDEGWSSAQEIVDAVREGNFRVLHQDDVGGEVFGWIERMARSEQEVGHG